MHQPIFSGGHIDSTPQPTTIEGNVAVFRVYAKPGQTIKLHVGERRWPKQATRSRDTLSIRHRRAPLPKTSQPHNEEAEPRREETPLESLASICTVLVVGLFILIFVFQNYEIPSASMVKTLLIGDHVMVDRTTVAPPTHWMPLVHYRAVRRNDIIVFKKPSPEPDGEYIDLVKRAVGVPGDRIHLRGGVLYVNGVAQNEPYISMPGDNGSSYNPYRDDFPSIPPGTDSDVTASWALELPNHIQGEDLVVPPGHVFAMGDNQRQLARWPLLGLRAG